jgi:hypothetical protein
MRAGPLGGAAERTWESFAGRALPVERRLAAELLARAAEQAGESAWAEAWTRGRSLRQDEAVALALDLPSAG